MTNPQLEDGYTMIANELLDAICMARIPGEAMQMFNLIIRKTYGFKKKEDAISTSQIIEFTGLSRRAAHRARKKLLEMNIITVTKKGHSQIITYSINKRYKTWKLSPKKVTVTQKVPGCDQKSPKVSPKKVTKCDPKSDTQKKEINSTKETTTKEKKTGKFSETDFIDILIEKEIEKESELFEILIEFYKNREEIKSPLTAVATKMLLSKLRKIASTAPDAIDILKESIMNNWKGIFPINNKKMQDASSQISVESLIEKFRKEDENEETGTSTSNGIFG